LYRPEVRDAIYPKVRDELLMKATAIVMNARNTWKSCVGVSLEINASGYNDNLNTKPALTQNVDVFLER
jgi:hypothetical protein